MRDFRLEIAPEILSRVKYVQKFKSSSVSQFSIELGLTQTKVNNQFNGKYDISLELICGILEKYPEVSAEWLLRGIGGMHDSIEDSKSNAGLIEEEKDKIIAELNEENAKIKDQIEVLYGILKRLTGNNN